MFCLLPTSKVFNEGNDSQYCSIETYTFQNLFNYIRSQSHPVMNDEKMRCID